MKKLNGIKLALATIALVALPLIAAICYDKVNTGPCQTSGSYVQTITCQVNCVTCNWTARDNNICLATFTRTNLIYASLQNNLGCTNGTTYLTCSTYTLSDRCLYSQDVLVCPDWLAGECLATVTNVGMTGPLVGIITPQMCPYN